MECDPFAIFHNRRLQVVFLWRFQHDACQQLPLHANKLSLDL
jgi:hypothetical protein